MEKVISTAALIKILNKGKDVEKVTKITNESFVINFVDNLPYLVFILGNHFYSVGYKFAKKKDYLEDDYGRRFYIEDGKIIQAG